MAASSVRLARGFLAVGSVTALALSGCSGATRVGTTQTPEAPTRSSTAVSGRPLTFSLPRIEVSGRLSPTTAVKGVVSPPAGALTWVKGYDRAVPGDVGTAVIAGHVFNGDKPDVFAELERVEVGDHMSVVDTRGTKVDYAVTSIRVATKKEVSHDPDVWGANDSVRRLAVITCDDEDGFRPDGHRIANLVVVAEAV